MTTSATAERRRLHARRALLVLTTALCSSLALPAVAQVAATPPTRPSVDANGVDLFLGTMNVDGPTLSAGVTGPQGMVFRKFNHGGGWGDNIVATLTVSGTITYVSFGTTTNQFSGSTSTEGDGATLSLSGNVYTYTAADGTVAHFNKLYVGGYPYGSVTGVVTDITRPNGEVLTFNYQSASYCAATKPGADGDVCTQHRTAYRIATVTNNTQYQLSFAYGNWDGLGFDPDAVPDPTTFQNWGMITGVAVTNTAVSGATSRSQTFTPTTGGGYSYYAISDAMNRTTTYRSGASGVLGVQRAGSTGEDVTATYDSSARVNTITTAAGTTTYTYADNSGTRTTTVTDPLGHPTIYEFNISLQRMTGVTNALGKKTTMAYDSYGRLTRVTAPETNYTNYVYDARGNVTETRLVAKSGSGLSDIVATASYDSVCSNTLTCNQPGSRTDPRGNTTNYSYDGSNGNLLTVAAPAATSGGIRPTTTYTYTTVNGVSLLNTVSTCRTTSSCVGTADEVRTTIAYNSNGLPTTVTKQAGDGSVAATVTAAYDDVGNVTSVDGPLSGAGDTTFYRYDADREQVGVIAPDPDGAGPLNRAATRTTYDANGRSTLVETGTVSDVTDTAWSAFSPAQSLATTYDALDRPLTKTLASGGTTYAITQMSYDHHRLDCTAVRMNNSSWSALPSSACTSQAAGAAGPDQITKYSYDNADRQTVVTSAYGSAGAQSDDATTAYTDNGKVASLLDANGNRTTYGYDGFDRIVTTSYPSTSTGSGSSNASDYEQLGYDANSNVTARRLRDGSTLTYVYDALNRVTSRSGPDPTVNYTYDLLSHPLSVARPADALTVTLAWDTLGRQTGDTQAFGNVSYLYDAAGRRTRMTWWDGFFVTYDYDNAGRMIAIRENGGIALATFAYDSLGRRTALTRANGVVTNYGYDAVSRLSSLSYDLAGTSADQAVGFSYSPASQITSTTRSNDSYAWTGSMNVNRGYTANGLNQYTAAGGISLVYDARGNLTTSGADGYTYDSLNRLKTRNNGTSLVYDSLDRLQEYDTSVATRFVYDGGDIVAEVNNPTGAIQKRYVFGPGADEALVEYDASGNKTWLVADERGSIVARTDASGTGISINAYDEFGIPKSSNVGRFQYTGQAWLPELGLAYFKSRMYSPTLGRFLQTDTIGYTAGLNWYNYVIGDPINKTDSLGTDLDKWNWNCYGNCGSDSGYWNTGAEGLRTPAQRLTDAGWTHVAGGWIPPAAAKNPVASTLGNGCGDPGGDILVCGRPIAADIKWQKYDVTFGRGPELILSKAQETTLEFRLLQIQIGHAKANEVLSAKDLGLPGNKTTFYSIYRVTDDSMGFAVEGEKLWRIAHIPGSFNFYFSPYHYRPGPGAKDVWIELLGPGPN